MSRTVIDLDVREPLHVELGFNLNLRVLLCELDELPIPNHVTG